MSEVDVDDRGRIYVPKDVREEYGKKFRIVKLENSIKLIPVEEKAVEGLKDALTGAKDLDIEDIDGDVEKKIREELEGDL